MRLRTLLAAALLALAFAGQASAVPNIIYIMTDDMRADDIETMPKLKELIQKQGLTFTNSYVDFSLCCPSRTSFSLGQSSHNHGITSNDGSLFAPFESNALPVWLKAAGYRTGLVGKYVAFLAPVPTIPPGWDSLTAFADALDYFNYTLNRNGVAEPHGSADADYSTDVLGQAAVDFATTATQPFFLWWAPKAPHLGGTSDEPELAIGPQPAPRHVGVYRDLPLPMPPGFNLPASLWLNMPLEQAPLAMMTPEQFVIGRDVFRNRRESLLAVDEWIGRLVQALSSRGVLGNTVILFTSDNGWVQGEFRRWRGKEVIKEPVSRLPLIVRGPGVNVNERREQLVNNLDVTATVIQLAGATAGRLGDGKSLVPLFTNSNAAWRTHLLIEGNNNFTAVGVPGIPDATTIRASAVRTKDWIYVEHVDGSLELYHLARDKYAIANRAYDPAFASIVSALSPKLAQLKTCAGVAAISTSCWITAAQPTITGLPAPPKAGLGQSKTATQPGELWTLSWSSTGASSCALQFTDQRTIESSLGGTKAGSVARSRPASGREYYFIDCVGPGGTARADIFHQVN